MLGLKPYAFDEDDDLTTMDHDCPKLRATVTPWLFVYSSQQAARARRAVLGIHQVAYPALIVGGVTIPIREN